MPAHPIPGVQARRWAFAAAVRARRKALGLTQQQLAGRAGCARHSIHRVENAVYSLSLDSVNLLADALGTTAGELLADADARMSARLKAAS